MKDRIIEFLCLSATEQIRYLKEDRFLDMKKDRQIEFLKRILKSETSSKTMASALKKLRELKYRDRFFFRKFLYHVDSSVANAARKAMGDSAVQQDSGVIRIVDMVKKESPQNRPAAVKELLSSSALITETVLVSLLQMDDLRVRETIVDSLPADLQLDETVLGEAVKNAVWYVRSALLEILGKRRSKVIYDLADLLKLDKNVDVRLKLVEALERLGSEQAGEYLNYLSRDANQWVRKRASKALVNIS